MLYVVFSLHLICFYLCFLLHFTTFLAASISPLSSYIPDFNYVALTCGRATNATSLDGRNWIGDANSKFYSLNQNNASSAFAESIYGVPYTTARISRFQFTYLFPVTAGTQFIRLHFYLASYEGFNYSEPLFSVKADNHTLLDNFSAADYAKALGFDIFYKEFWVGVEDDRTMHLTLSPSPGMQHVYAFLNGIETMSMPTGIYYTAASNPALKFLGQNKPLGLDNRTALEVIYRINIGGKHIPPSEDTVLFRCWSSDEAFLTVAKPGAIPFNSTIQLKFSTFTRFTAPDMLYRTGRTMGVDRAINKNYNLTWEFPVDSGFTYFIRLHFCEFQPEITQVGDRVFQIYIADQIAESKADIIYWSGGNGVPVYRDYAVTMTVIGSKKLQNMSVALHPTVHSDAFLNGIEIFRLRESKVIHDTVPTKRSSKAILIRILVMVGAVLGIFLLLLLIFLIRRQKYKNSSNRAPWWTPFVSSTENTKNHDASVPDNLCRRFSLYEIKLATNNFDNVRIIGAGGFGNVYRGKFNDGAAAVAIKRLSAGSEQGANEFKTEIEMLSQLRHRHLVSLIGYCNEDHEMILVYDYMANGTLSDHLYNTSNPPLPWNQRLEICIGAARGLRYLHSEAKNAIIHRDVKSTNILLDENWTAKVSDFGLSKIRPVNNSKTHIFTVVKGSYGYLDPEYYRRQQLTEKSDVYSFGVVLFEVLCARPALDQTIVDDYDDQVSLAVWAKECYCSGTLDQIIDPFLKGKIAPDCFKRFSGIAVSCLLDERIKRPSMSDVVLGLEHALRTQEKAENSFKHGGEHAEIYFNLDVPLKVSPDIVSLLRTSSIDESYSNISIDASYSGSSVVDEMLSLGPAENNK